MIKGRTRWRERYCCFLIMKCQKLCWETACYRNPMLWQFFRLVFFIWLAVSLQPKEILRNHCKQALCQVLDFILFANGINVSIFVDISRRCKYRRRGGKKTGRVSEYLAKKWAEKKRNEWRCLLLVLFSSSPFLFTGLNLMKNGGKTIPLRKK